MVNQNFLKMEGLLSSANGVGLLGLYLLLEGGEESMQYIGGGLIVLSVILPFIRGLMKGPVVPVRPFKEEGEE